MAKNMPLGLNILMIKEIYHKQGRLKLKGLKLVYYLT